MKKIKIFLGSSITEFEKERNDLELFIRNVSDEFEEKYNIKLVPLRCENMDNYVRTDGTQNAINEELVLSSDMCFFILFTKAGEFTEEEFRIAFEKFKKDGKPKIYIYFKNIPEGQTVEDSVYNFMSKIDNELKHYYGSFDHIDTIKLRILLNLKLQEMDFVSVEFENGKCVVDGKQTLDLSNVSEFANNNILQQLQKELTEVEEYYLQMKPIYDKENVSDAFYKEYAEVSSKRQNLIDSVEELQKNIFNMSLRICKDEVHGDITIRQKEAYRLFELGDYEGAITILDSNDIDNDFFAFEKQEEEKLRKRAQIYIKEHKTAIDILMTMINYQNRFNEIEERYEKIIKIAEKYSVKLDIIYDYAVYLDSQNNDYAECQYKKIETLYTQQKERFSSDFILTFFLRFSLYYGKQRDNKKAFVYAKKLMDITSKLYKEKPQFYFTEYAFACLLYSMGEISSGTKSKSLQFLNKGKKALEIQCKLSNSENTKVLLAEYYNQTGLVYQRYEEYKISEQNFLAGIKILEEIKTKNKTIGDLYLNLAETIRLSDSNSNKGDTIIRYINKSINIFEQLNKEKNEITQKLSMFEILAEEDPTCIKALADAYNNMSIYYGSYEANYYWAIKYLRKSEHLYKVLYLQNSRKNGLDLAENYINLASSQDSMNNRNRAIDSLKNGITILEELYQSNHARFAEKLSWAYSEAGIMFLFWDDIDSSLDLFEKSLFILENTNSETYIRVYVEIMQKIWSIIDLKLHQNDAENLKLHEINPKELNLLNMYFKFFYSKIDMIADRIPEVIETFYDIGRNLTTSYEKIDTNTAKEYYKMMIDIGKRTLRNTNLPKDKRIAIGTEVAIMLGLLGEVDQGNDFLIENIKPLL